MQRRLQSLLSRRKILGCVLFTFVSVHANAQASSGAPLTLKDAVQLALKQNIDLQISNLDAAVVQQDTNVARAALLPQASFQATEQIERYNLEALIGLQFAGVSKNVGPFQAFHAGVRFSSPVFDLSLIRRYQASGHRVQASRDDIASTREQTVLLTVSQYLACLRAQAEVTAAKSRVELARSLEKQAEALFADGVATRVDVSRAKVRLLNEQQRLIDANRDTEITLYALARILNLQNAATPRLLDAGLFSETPTLEVTDPLTSALTLRPELHSFANSVLAAQSERKAAFSESLPTLNVTGFWNQQGRTFGNVFPGYDYQATLNVPLFTGGRLRAERASTRNQEQRCRAQLQDARNRVTEQVTTDQQELQAARSDVDLGRQQVALAHDQVTLAQGRFSAGVTDNIEVTTAQDELARANDLEIAAFYRYNVARANLARAAGLIELTYLRP